MQASDVTDKRTENLASPSVAESLGTTVQVLPQPGPPVVDQKSMELVRRLRDGENLSASELATSLGLSEPCLRSLVGVFSRISEEPRQYAFTLVIPSVGTPQQMHFDGRETTRVELGHDGTRLREQFKINGLNYRRDHAIDTLLDKFDTFPPARQRREFEARFGAELDRLLPKALQVWFWSPHVNAHSLAARISLLVAKCKPMPAPSGEVGAAAFAAAFAAASAELLSSGKFEKGSVEHGFAKDLGDACARTLCAEAVAAAIESQAARLKAHADKTMASSQLKSIQAWAARTLLRVNDEKAPPSGCQGLIDALCRYPARTDWRGSKAHPKDISSMQDLARELQNRATDRTKAFLTFLQEKNVSDWLIGRTKEIDDEEKASIEDLDKVCRLVQIEIESMQRSYKYGMHATTVLNCWFRCGYAVLATRALHATYLHGMGFLSAFRAAMHARREGQLLPAEKTRIETELTRHAPEALKTDLMPRVRMWRDLFRAMEGVRPGTPASAQRCMDDLGSMGTDLVFGSRVGDLLEYWFVDKYALCGDWAIERTTNVGSMVDTALEVVSFKGVSLTDFDKAEGLQESMETMVDFGLMQLFAMDTMCRRAVRKHPDVTADKLRAARQNAQFVVQGLRELSDAYAYLLECAGQPVEDDWIISAIDRKICILETAALAAKANERMLRSTVSLEKAESATPQESQQEIYVPQLPGRQDDAGTVVPEQPSLEVRAPDASGETSTAGTIDATARIEGLSALPNTHLTGQLHAARVHFARGRRAFQRIDGSASQKNSIHLAATARSEFRDAREGLRSVLQAAGRITGVRPSGFPSSVTLEKEVKNAAFWAELTQNLLSGQLDRLLFPTGANAMAQLCEKKGAVQVKRPSAFVHQLRHVDEGGQTHRDQIVELEVKFYATARWGSEVRKEAVQTMWLHCHVDPALQIRTREDLRKIDENHIRAAHVKPDFYRMMTNRTAGAFVTEQGAIQSRRVPYAPLPLNLVKRWLNNMSNKA